MDATHRWEVSNPMSWIFEFFDIFLWNVHHSQQVVLEFDWLNILWEFWRISVFLQLIIQLDGCSTNRHTCTMETEGEQYIVPIESFIPGVEIALGHGKCVSQVEQTIHICVWEGLEEFGFLVGFYGEILVSFPDVSCSLFETDQFISSDGTGLFLLFHD